MVDLKATPDRLPAAQRAALLAAAQHSLDAFTTPVILQPGDHYLTPEGKTFTATRPFVVTLRFHLDESAIVAPEPGCEPYCGSVQPPWGIAPTITWDYTDDYGKPESTQQGSGAMSEMVWVDMTWDGSWHVVLQQATTGSLLCSIVAQQVMDAMRPLRESGSGVGCPSQPISAHEDGMLVQASFSKNGSSELADTGYVLYRAGALIALDANAHALFPTLPSPGAHELEVARQLGFHS